MQLNKHLSTFFILMGLAILTVATATSESLPRASQSKTFEQKPMERTASLLEGKNKQQIIENNWEPGLFYLRIKPNVIQHIKGEEWVNLEKDILDAELKKKLQRIPDIKIRRLAENFNIGDRTYRDFKSNEFYDATQLFSIRTRPEVTFETLAKELAKLNNVIAFFPFTKITLTSIGEAGDPGKARDSGEAGDPGEVGDPEDPGYVDEWRFHRDQPYGVNFEDAWDRGPTGQGVNVGFIDYTYAETGVNDHLDIYDHLRNTVFTTPSPNCDDHGAFTTQQTLGTANNNFGTRGGAYNASLSFYDLSGPDVCIGSSDSVLRFLIYASDDDLQILNMSIGITLTSDTAEGLNQDMEEERSIWEPLFLDLFHRGTLVIISAGNNTNEIVGTTMINNEEVYYVITSWCLMEGTFCVGATDDDGRRAKNIFNDPEVGSTYGPVDDPVVLIGAPATNFPVYRIEKNGLIIEEWGGTSSAAPLVSAVGGLVSECLTSLYPRSFTNEEDKVRTIRDIILHNGKPMQENDFPNGIVNAAKAVESACSEPEEYSVEIYSPVEGSSVSGPLNVTMLAPYSRGVEIESIELFLDDTSIAHAHRSEIFEYTIDTTSFMNGEYVLHILTHYADGVTFVSDRVHINFYNFGNPNNEPPPGGYPPPPGDPGGPFYPELFHAPENGGVVNGIIPVRVEVGGPCRIIGGCENIDKWNIWVYADGKEIGRAEHLDHAGAVITFNLDTTQYDDFEPIELVLKEEELDCTLFSICWSRVDYGMVSRIFVTPYNSDPSENTPFFTQPGRTSIDVEEGSGQSLTFQVSSAHPQFIQSVELWFYSQYAPDLPVKIATDTTAPFIFENIPVSTWGTNKLYTFYAEVTDINGVRLSSKLTSIREVYVHYRTCSDWGHITSPRQDIIEWVDTKAVLMWVLSNPCPSHSYDDIQTVSWYVDNALVSEQSTFEEVEYSTENLEDGDHPLKLIVKFNDGFQLVETGMLSVEHKPLPACSGSLPLGSQPEKYSEIKGETLLTLQQPVRSDLQWVRWEGERRGERETIDETSSTPYTGHWYTNKYSNHNWVYRAIGLLENGQLFCSEWRDVTINNAKPKFEENVEDQVE